MASSKGVTDVSPISVRLRARELDDVSPLLGFFCDTLAIFGGREGKHFATEVGKARLQLGVGKGGGDFPFEHVNDFGWRVLRRPDSAPRTRLKTRHEVAHCRNVRELVQSRRCAHS